MGDEVQITELLNNWSNGDEHSLEQLMPIVEAELRRIAHQYMKRENVNHTLQTTALVNEAYLRLVDKKSSDWKNRSHFFAISATLMRQILTNHARDQRAQKRGGGVKHIDMESVAVVSPQKSDELLALDEALKKLKTFDNLKSRIVEMRYFGGLTIEETAEVLKIAPQTVSLHWRLAKAWLAAELKK